MEARVARLHRVGKRFVSQSEDEYTLFPEVVKFDFKKGDLPTYG